MFKNPRVSPSHCSGSSVATSSTVTCSEVTNSLEDRSVYARAWRFVQRRLHLRPRASSCPVEMESKTTKTVEDSSSLYSDWSRVYLLKELEKNCTQETTESVQPLAFRTQAQRKVAQTKCVNCGLLFFRPLADAPDTSAFCSRDCQSSFEYRRDLQDAVNEQETFRSMGWMQSSEL